MRRAQNQSSFTCGQYGLRKRQKYAVLESSKTASVPLHNIAYAGF